MQRKTEQLRYYSKIVLLARGIFCQWFIAHIFLTFYRTCFMWLQDSCDLKWFWNDSTIEIFHQNSCFIIKLVKLPAEQRKQLKITLFVFPAKTKMKEKRRERLYESDPFNQFRVILMNLIFPICRFVQLNINLIFINYFDLTNWQQQQPIVLYFQ